MNDTVARYLACWNETSPDARLKLISETWAAGGRYTDPLADAQGTDQIDAVIAAVQAQFPGFVFTLASPVDAHHQQARFTWGLGPAGEEPLVVGFDVALSGPDGLLTAVHGWLDKVPS